MANKIIKSSMDMVLNENPEQVQLAANQLTVWDALLPILSRHGLLAVRTSGLAAAEERFLTKKQAAEFLGISSRKLQNHMRRKQIRYEKYGAGRTAGVRFKLSELWRFQESRSAGRIDKDCK
ncbi:MAG TPA: helix-turn-helix domain-containing protein [Clostridia bacterium]|nr:helix-turn-helix domain-containing protein [Clostridia bacterium]